VISTVADTVMSVVMQIETVAGTSAVGPVTAIDGNVRNSEGKAQYSLAECNLLCALAISNSPGSHKLDHYAK